LVLVVEDREANRYALDRMLRAAGFDVRQAASGTEALRLVPAMRPDLIVSDVNMPGLDGFGFCQALKQDPATGHIPLLMISASFVRGSDQAHGLQCGADGYLVEPIDPQVLVATIGALLRARRAEQALRESEERFRIMADGLPFMIWVTNAEGRLEFVNQKYCEFFGVTPDQLSGPGWQSLLYSEDGPAYVAEFQACSQARRPFHAQARVRRVDGEWRWIESSAQPRLSAAGQFLGYVGSSPDITERRWAEMAIRESRELLQRIIDNAPAAIFMKDLSGRFVLSNRRHAAALGCAPEAVIGKTDADFARVAPRSAEYQANDRLVAESGSAMEFEEFAPGPDGSEHVYLAVKFAVRDAAGRVRGICGIATDITHRKHAEQELARSNAELEQFASVVSHDLRSPMMTLTGCAQILGMECRECASETVKQSLGYIKDGITRMNRLITALLAYSRVGRGRILPAKCPMQEVLAEVLSGLQSRLTATGALVTSDPLPDVPADRTLMAQLLQNLIENAIKYHGAQSPRVYLSAERRSGECVFSVRDNGIGIAPEHHEKIFGVFQRLHADESRFAGLGLGLATCRRIVERHNGRLWVESVPGRGSTFRFSIPD